MILEKKLLTVETVVNKIPEMVWDCWTHPGHIVHWNFAHESWHCTAAENNLTTGGKFSYCMAAKDGSAQFDFEGIYDCIELYSSIKFTLADSRKVEINFRAEGISTRVTETFEPEEINSPELQKAGWQSILNQFKQYTESL